MRLIQSRAFWRSVLGASLLALLFATLFSDRRAWPGFLGDEVTYLMAAESLAFEGNLSYAKTDYDRFLRHWQRPPEGLILQSGDHGRTVHFGKPIFYSVYLAPFVRLHPTRGPFVANALLLALAVAVSLRTLEARAGDLAALWLWVFLFGSVVFSYVFWAHSDLFLMSLVAVSFAVVSRRRSQDHKRSWIVGGCLLAIVIFSRPIYLPFALLVGLLVPAKRRFRTLGLLALSGGLVVAASASYHKASSGAWTSYGGERGGFYQRTGFPDVDFPRSEWTDSIFRFGNVAWGGWQVDAAASEADSADRWRLTAWDSLYFFLGRHVGIVPYFLPFLLALVPGARARLWWAFLLAAAASMAILLVFRPFNFWGGGAAMANRYFLVVYPVFWFAAAPKRARWALASMALASLFVYPTWLQGASYPRTELHTYRYVSPLAKRLLPYETSQSHLKPSGQEDVIHNGLWVKMLTPELRSRGEQGFRPTPGRRVSMLVGSAQTLDEITMEVSPSGAAIEWLDGGVLERGSAEGTYTIQLSRPRARHPMWWTESSFNLYEIAYRALGDPGETVEVVFRKPDSGGGR